MYSPGDHVTVGTDLEGHLSNESPGLRCRQRILGALKASQRPGNFLDFIAVKLFGVGLNDKIINFMECAPLARRPVLGYPHA